MKLERQSRGMTSKRNLKLKLILSISRPTFSQTKSYEAESSGPRPAQTWSRGQEKPNRCDAQDDSTYYPAKAIRDVTQCSLSTALTLTSPFGSRLDVSFLIQWCRPDQGKPRVCCSRQD